MGNFGNKLIPFIIGLSILNYSCSLEKKIYVYKSQTKLQQNIIKDFQPKNLQDIVDYFDSFKFKYDKGEEWQSPLQTINLGTGDCDDFAILGAYFAEKIGYRPKMLCMYRIFSPGHALTLLEETKTQEVKFGFLEKGRLIFPQFNSVKEVIKYVNEEEGFEEYEKYIRHKIIELNSSCLIWKEAEGDIFPLAYTKSYMSYCLEKEEKELEEIKEEIVYKRIEKAGNFKDTEEFDKKINLLEQKIGEIIRERNFLEDTEISF